MVAWSSKTLQNAVFRRVCGKYFFQPFATFGKFKRFLNIADVHSVIQKNNTGGFIILSWFDIFPIVGILAVPTENSGIIQ